MRLLNYILGLFMLVGVSNLAQAQTTYTPQEGCGVGGTMVPNLIRWQWGMNGEFTPGKSFYEWLADSKTSGTYILARAQFDSRGVTYGGWDQGTAACKLYRLRFDFSSVPNTTSEMMWVALDPSRYTFSQIASGTIGGVKFSNKMMATRANNSNLYFTVAGYFDAKRAVPGNAVGTDDINIAAPSTASLISGGQSATTAGGSLYSFAGLSGYNPTDGVIPVLQNQNGYARFAACAENTSLNYSFCTYGPNSGISFAGTRENKTWKFDFVVTKRVAASMTVDALTDYDLPSIGVARLYVFSNGSSTYDQMTLCIQGKYSLGFISAQKGGACGGSDSVNPPAPPIVPTCSNSAGLSTTSVIFDPVGWSDFNGNTNGVRYTTTSPNNNVKPFSLSLDCNYKPTLTLILKDDKTCTGLTNKDARGVLCNTSTTTPVPNANFQVFRALTNTSQQCSLIDGLGTGSNSSFAPVSLGATIPASAMSTSAGVLLDRYYYWNFCARYYTEKTTETDLGSGDVQGRMTYEFTYN